MLRRAIIFANGELAAPEPRRAQLQHDDLLIAADGGVRHCRAWGLIPHVVVGDLDSLAERERAALEKEGVRLHVQPAAKDETDLELALLYAADQGVDWIAVLGALGGRLDMTIANVLLLAHPRLAHVHLELWHGSQTAWLIRPPGGDIPGQVGDTLSLLPLAGDADGISAHGLAYPLHNERLAAGPARGVSNVLVAAPARVDLREGLLLAVLTAGHA